MKKTDKMYGAGSKDVAYCECTGQGCLKRQPSSRRLFWLKN